MSEPFLSQISIFAFNFPPKGWAFANGQTLPINQNQALFALMGTTYGGDGRTTFQLPNLQGRIPVHMGAGNTIGEVNGTETVTVTTAEMPAHSHAANCSKSAAGLASASGAVWAADGDGNLPYSTAGGSSMAGGTIGFTGGGQAHNNLAPFSVLNFCVALAGIFPSRN